jgi:hypothetical protein
VNHSPIDFQTTPRREVNLTADPMTQRAHRRPRRSARRPSSVSLGHAAGTPPGHAATATRLCTGRRSTPTARRLEDRRPCESPTRRRFPTGGGPIEFAASAEAGREFDKLVTDLTTPRDSLTREVNLVVSLSRTPRLLLLPAGAICYPVTTGFRYSYTGFANGARRGLQSLLLTKPSITRSLGLASADQASDWFGPPPAPLVAGRHDCARD